MNGFALSLVIPAFNEQAGIRQAILEADQALRRLTVEHEILVVDDGSRDETAAVVEAMSSEVPSLRLLRQEHNRGYGAALRTGFEAARFPLVAFTDADCQFHLDDLASLLPLTEQHDIAVGYRIDRKDPARRRFFSWGYNVLARALVGTGVRDVDCALKVFRRAAVLDLLPEDRGFLVNTEMLALARQRGHTVAEVGVRHRPRLRGASKVSLGDIPRTLRSLLPFWWSRILFPGEPTTNLTNRTNKGDTRGWSYSWDSCYSWLLLFAVAAVLFFSRLGAPLQEPDEGRYAEIPRQMLLANQWTVPVLHGEPYLDKPPLLYWLVMGAYRVFGVHDWAARLVSSTAAFLVVVVTFFWGRRALGQRAALTGAFILCLSARFVYLGRMLTMDGLLALCVVAALASAHTALTGGRLRWGWWLSSALCCGLGFLTKGPIALVLVAAPVFAFACLDRRVAKPRWFAWGLYTVVTLLVAGPWFVAVAIEEPDFLGYFFWRHNVVRFAVPFDHAKPVWYHLPGLLLGMMPWTFLLPGLVWFLGRRAATDAMRRPPAVGFFLLAGLWAIVFFSLGGSKRAVHILPAMPPLALALGWYLAAQLQWDNLAGWVPTARLGRLAGTTVAVTGIGCAVVAVVSELITPSVGFVLSLGGLVLLCLLWRFGPSLSAVASWRLSGALTFLVLLVAVQVVLPAYARRFALRGHVRPYAALCADREVPVMCYPKRWDSVGFYLRRGDVRVYGTDQERELLDELQRRPRAVVVFKADSPLRRMLEDLPGTMEFVPRERGGAVMAGVVRPRAEPPIGLFAGR